MGTSATLVGRLTRDPELRHTPSGTAVASFTVAVDMAGDKQDDGKYASGFFDVTCFGRTAENVATYCAKGSQVAVFGRLLHHRWESKEGEKRQRVEVTAERVDFIGSRSERSEDDDGQQRVTTARTTADFTGAASDDDIPF